MPSFDEGITIFSLRGLEKRLQEGTSKCLRQRGSITAICDFSPELKKCSQSASETTSLRLAAARSV